MKRVASGLVALLLVFLTIPNAFAEDAVELSLVSQSKLWLTERSNITFQFVEANSLAVSNAQVEISKAPLLGRSAIRNVISKPNSISYANIYESTSIEVIENKSSFTLPGSRLKFHGAGTYALRITSYVRGEAQRITSFIAFLPKAVRIQNLNVAAVLPLSVNAGLAPNDAVLNNSAAKSFLPNKNLNALLSAGISLPEINWLLDSDTIRLAEQIAANREVVLPNPHNLTEAEITGAGEWLATIRSNLNTLNTYVLPTGNVDATALNQSDHKRLATAAITDSQYVSTFFNTLPFKRITIAPKGDYSDKGFDWLSSNNVKFNLLGSNKYESKSGVFTPSGVAVDGNGNKSPVIDQYGSKLFSDAISSSNNPAMYQAAFAGDLLITALEQPSIKRFIVLMPDMNLETVTKIKSKSAMAAFSAPWLNLVKLSDYENYSANNRNRSANASDYELPGKSANAIRYAQQTRKYLASLISGAVEESQLDFAVIRLANIEASQKSLEQLQNQTNLFLDELNNAVRIMSSGSVIFPGESAAVPITIRNDLSVPIEIGIRSQGIPSVRVIPAEVPSMTIAPGRRKSIEIPTRLIGTDTAYLQLQLVDSAGKKIGLPISIEVSSSAYAQAAAWVIGTAFLLLIVFAVRNTLKRIKLSHSGSRENK